MNPTATRNSVTLVPIIVVIRVQLAISWDCGILSYIPTIQVKHLCANFEIVGIIAGR